MRVKKQLYPIKKLNEMITLPKFFPDRLEWENVIYKFASCPTYWKIPKTYSINEEKVKDIVNIMQILTKYSESEWNLEIQKNIYRELRDKKLIEPYVGEESQSVSSYTALTRIIKKQMEYLGLVWISEKGFTITKAGETLTKLKLEKAFELIGQQIMKYQFDHIDINPSVFIAKVLINVGFKIFKEEWIIFINMSSTMGDIENCCNLIKSWRNLPEDKQKTLLSIFKKVPRILGKEKDQFEQIEIYPTPRYLTIEREYPYQKSFILFPFRNYLQGDSSE